MSNIKVGDIVNIKDISYACVYKDGYGYVSFCSCGVIWDVKYKVVATELVLPSITMDGKRGRLNDTILECVDKNLKYELICIRSAYLVPCEDKQIARLQNVVDDLTNRLNNMTQLNHILEAITRGDIEFYTTSSCGGLWIYNKNKRTICVETIIYYSAYDYSYLNRYFIKIAYQGAKNIFSQTKKNYSWTFEEIITQSPNVLIRD